MPEKQVALAGTPPASTERAATPDGARGFMATVGRIAVVVACLSGVVGLLSSTEALANKVRALLGGPTKVPRITVAPGGVLGVSWSATERSLTFAYNADLLNEGDAPDRFLSARAYLMDPLALAGHPGIRATLAAIEMTENGQGVRFPLNVDAGQRRALGLRVVPDAVDRDPFAEAGVYRLVLELENHGSPSRGTYCFFMGRETLVQLREQGFLRVSPYLECQES
ncbi:MAG TPA: hypothetical protein VFQ51_07455 [Vicinamibacteria bacterium]|nr:hypothetical protein [Vicinamibacteria bacterium]